MIFDIYLNRSSLCGILPASRKYNYHVMWKSMCSGQIATLHDTLSGSLLGCVVITSGIYKMILGKNPPSDSYVVNA